jgi:3-hydroxyacyl-[acyl-carrier-protein] dehydratase
MMLDTNQIKEIIPHRFPFLLVDRVIEVEKGKKAIGIKNITVNDFFAQHEYFEGQYLLSWALQVEAMAQVAGFIIAELAKDSNSVPLFAGIEKARFRRTARPGDQLRIEVQLQKYKAKIGKFRAKSYINNKIASEAIITCALATEE